MDADIRHAEFDDLPDIVRIYNQAVDHRATADLDHVTIDDRVKWFQNHPSDVHPILVATVNDNVVGWISISPHRPGRLALRSVAEVSYYVDYRYHANGLGSQLLAHVVDLCPVLGIKDLFAILLEDNTASIAMLMKFGFVLWGRLPNVAQLDDREVSQVYFGRRL